MKGQLTFNPAGVDLNHDLEGCRGCGEGSTGPGSVEHVSCPLLGHRLHHPQPWAVHKKLHLISLQVSNVVPLNGTVLGAKAL